METQFDLPEVLEIYQSHKNYEIYDLNLEDNRCLIYFSSQWDMAQAESVRSSPNVYPFPFNLANHPHTCYPINYLDLWQLSNQKLINLSQKYQGRMFSPLGFSLQVSNWLKTGKYVWHCITVEGLAPW
jgi:hypothetical protein